MRTKKSSLAARLLLALAWGALITTSIAPPRIRGWSASAETTKVPKLRTIQGEVCSKDGRPIQGAVVYLQDSKSLAVKSYLSDDDGKFHFRHLSMNLDYDLWAELNGKRSKTKNISQFNDKPNLSYKLKLPMTK